MVENTEPQKPVKPVNKTATEKARAIVLAKIAANKPTKK